MSNVWHLIFSVVWNGLLYDAVLRHPGFEGLSHVISCIYQHGCMGLHCKCYVLIGWTCPLRYNRRPMPSARIVMHCGDWLRGCPMLSDCRVVKVELWLASALWKSSSDWSMRRGGRALIGHCVIHESRDLIRKFVIRPEFWMVNILGKSSSDWSSPWKSNSDWSSLWRSSSDWSSLWKSSSDWLSLWKSSSDWLSLWRSSSDWSLRHGNRALIGCREVVWAVCLYDSKFYYWRLWTHIFLYIWYIRYIYIWYLLYVLWRVGII